MGKQVLLHLHGRHLVSNLLSTRVVIELPAFGLDKLAELLEGFTDHLFALLVKLHAFGNDVLKLSIADTDFVLDHGLLRHVDSLSHGHLFKIVLQVHEIIILVAALLHAFVPLLRVEYAAVFAIFSFEFHPCLAHALIDGLEASPQAS